MASNTACSYATRPGTRSQHGQRYEVKMACLLFLRAVRSGRKFHLAANLDEAGAFDDVVLTLDSPPKTYLIQLKHKANCEKIFNRSILLPVLSFKNDFSLLKYFLSFRDEVRSQFKSNSDHKVFGRPFDECSLVLYTNARFQGEPEISDRWDGILSTSATGLMYSFDKDKDEDVFSFANHILLYTKFLEQIVGDDTSTIRDQVANFMDDYKTRYPLNKHKGNSKILDMASRIKNNSNNNQIRDQMNKLSALGDLSEYESFLNRLTLCTGQITEVEMNGVIKNELSHVLKISIDHSESIYRSVLDSMQQWCESEDGQYLTEESPVIEDTIQQAAHDMHESTWRELKIGRVGFAEIRDEDRTVVLGGSQVVLCLVEGKCTRLTAGRVMHTLQRANCQFVMGTGQEALSLWQKHDWPLLVAACDREDRGLLLRVSAVLEQRPGKRVILIARKDDCELVKELRNFTKDNVAEITDKITLETLDRTSQQFVLAMKVNIQGQYFSLEEMLQGKEDLMECITSDNLMRFLKNDNIYLGDKLEECLPHYIPRRLLREDIVSPPLLRDLLRQERLVFALVGVTEEDVQHLVPPEETLCPFDGRLTPECRFYLVDDIAGVALLREQVGNLTVLTRQDDRFRILTSKGDVDVRRFLDCAEKSDHNPESVWDLREPAVIVAAEPGMGKSTLFTQMAARAKQAEPSVWIVRVNLVNMTGRLENIQEEQIDEECALGILTTAANVTDELVTFVFIHRAHTPGGVIAFFDGFDEICPDYTSKVVRIFDALLSRGTIRLCVSTRLNWKDCLEQSLGSISFGLAEFSVEEQRTYLWNSWSRGVRDANAERLKTFISKVLHTFEHSLKDDSQGSFMGNPLQTMLVAEVFRQYFDDGQDGRLAHMDIAKLYDAFFQKKCGVYFRDKRGDDITNPAVKKDMLRKLKQYEEMHILISLTLFMSSETLDRVHDRMIPAVVAKYLEENRDELLSIGIIQMDGNGNTRFLHRTIEEYFTAKWFHEHYSCNTAFLRDHLVTEGYSVVRTMLDLMLAKGSPLHVAVLSGDMKTLQQQANPRNMHSVDSGGRSLLHAAVSVTGRQANSEGILKFLLDNGCDLSVTDSVCQWSALQYADYSSNLAALEVVLSRSKVALELPMLKSAMIPSLLSACKEGHVKVLQYLLRSGVDVNAPLLVHKRRAIHVATEHGHLKAASLLIGAGAEINAEGGYGKTALHSAVNRRDHAALDLLLRHGADTDAKDWTNSTALHLAAKSGDSFAVSHLLQAGADVRAEDAVGCTALDLAISNRHTHVESLLSRTIDKVRTAEKTSLLHLAITRGDVGDVKRLLEGGADVDEREQDLTALHRAAALGDLQVVKLLVDRGGNMDARDMNKWTPLFYAAYKGHACVAEFLLGRGAASDGDVHGDTPLHFASVMGDVDIVRLVVNRKLDLNRRNDHSNTPLHFAASEGRLDVVCLLVDSGCSVATFDNDGDSPLHDAAKNGHLEVVRVLLEADVAAHVPNNKLKTPMDLAVDNQRDSVVRFLKAQGFVASKRTRTLWKCKACHIL